VDIMALGQTKTFFKMGSRAQDISSVSQIQ
jgi:hypothetical protein